MPLGTRVVVDLKPLGQNLKDLQTRAATLKAIRAGIREVQNVVKAAAPKRLGHLRRAQGTKAKKGRKGKTGSFGVQGAKTKYVKRTRPGKKSAAKPRDVRPAFYDHLVIGGTKPHGVKKGGGVVNKPHPGARPNPYRRKAYEAAKDAVGSVMVRVMGEETRKLLAKNALKLSRKK